MRGREIRLAGALVALIRLLLPGCRTERAAPVRRLPRLRVAFSTLAAVAIVVSLAPAAFAAYAVEPVGPSWVPNGGVHAVVADSSTVYVGGSFTGGVAALDAATGTLKWRGTANADVRALSLAPGGQLLLGGAFTTVGGATHRGIASVNAGTGAVNAQLRGAAGGTVRDIVVVGNIAYFGGQFVNHGGMAQQGLGAVDATTGALVPGFTPATNESVYSLGTDGTRLFFGGKFTAVNGQPRNYLASVTLSTNTLDSWAPAMACTGCNTIWDLTIAGNRVYTAGRNSGGLYAVDKASGATIYSLGGFSGDTQAVTLAPDGRLYLGGHFSSVGGVARMLVAEFDVTGPRPVLGAFSTRFVTSWPGVWAMASTGSRLYVGGDFTAAGSKVNNQNRFPYFAMFPSGSTPPGDTTAPTASIAPANLATNVPVANSVTATFDEPVQGVDNTTFTLAPAAGQPVAATVNSGTGNAWVLDPTADLAPSTTYTVTLTGGTTAIRDGANNPLSPNPTTSTFTTAAAPAGDGTPPTATLTNLPDGGTGVTLATNVVVTFSERVVGVETGLTLAPAGGTPVSAVVTSTNTAGTRWTLNPDVNLIKDTRYTVQATSGITDVSGNALSPVSWTFLTGPAPTVIGQVPAAGAAGVAATQPVTVTFNEAVQNVSGTTFTLTDGANAVTATVSPTGTTAGAAGRQYVLMPSAPLSAGTTYTAAVLGGTGGVADVAGNPLAATVTWNFTTA